MSMIKLVRKPLKLILQPAAVGLMVTLAACAPITPIPTPSTPPMPSMPSSPSSSSPSSSSGMPGSPGTPGDPGMPGSPGMPGAPGMPGDPGSDSSETGTSGSSGPSGSPSSGQLPDIGGGGVPGAPGSSGGKPGAEGDETDQAGDEGQAGDPSQQLPTWDSQKSGGKGEWETSNQIPEVPVDITRGSGPSGDGKPGKGDKGTETDPSGAAGELDEVLKDIDGGIMAERSEIKSRASAVPGDGSEQRAGGAMPGSPDATANAGSIGAASAGNPNEMPGMPDGIPNVANAPKAPRKGAGIPNDVADARDDDIISRQLREAAMQEEDPEIREKLWADYRRYKGR